MANAEWAAGKSWGNEICVTYRNIKRHYKYNHAHTATSLKEINRAMAVADEERNRRKAKAPGEMADMVSQGMERLAQLVHPLASIKESEPYSSESEIESAHTANSSMSAEETKRRRRRTTKREPRRRSPSPSPSTSRYPLPPTRRRSSLLRTSNNRTKKKKKDKKEKEKNLTGCKYCKKYGGTAHLPPKSILHSKCNYNKNIRN